MLFFKFVLVTVWWKLSVAAEAPEGTEDCAAVPEVARALLQHSGSTLHPAPVKPVKHKKSDCNWQCYLDRYQDLRQTLGEQNFAGAEQHWNKNGEREGRDCTCDTQLSAGQAAPPASPPKRSNERCLNFLHIPKNAGATMEVIRKEVKKVNTEKGLWSDAGLGGGKAGWAFGESILPFMKCNKGDPLVSPGKCELVDEQGHTGQCSAWHIPPDYDAYVAASYGECETFCIARHPLTKAVSQHNFLNGECTPEAFAEKIRTEATVLPSQPFREDCHWVPQAKYVNHCQHILRFETLVEDFNALMVDFDYPIRLAEHHMSHGIGHCDLGSHPELLDENTKAWLMEYYAADFQAFGYNISAVP